MCVEYPSYFIFSYEKSMALYDILACIFDWKRHSLRCYGSVFGGFSISFSIALCKVYSFCDFFPNSIRSPRSVRGRIQCNYFKKFAAFPTSSYPFLNIMDIESTNVYILFFKFNLKCTKHYLCHTSLLFATSCITPWKFLHVLVWKYPFRRCFSALQLIELP